MDAAAELARVWAYPELRGEVPVKLQVWIRLRMRAYAEGGWEGDQESMVEWIAIDLAVDDEDARKLCDGSGWILP